MRRKMKTAGDCEEEITFEPKEGVAQGAPESPILHCLFMNDLSWQKTIILPIMITSPSSGMEVQIVWGVEETQGR